LTRPLQARSNLRRDAVLAVTSCSATMSGSLDAMASTWSLSVPVLAAMFQEISRMKMFLSHAPPKFDGRHSMHPEHGAQIGRSPIALNTTEVHSGGRPRFPGLSRLARCSFPLPGNGCFLPGCAAFLGDRRFFRGCLSLAGLRCLFGGLAAIRIRH